MTADSPNLSHIWKDLLERSENQSAVLPYKDRNGPQAQPISTGISNRAPTSISLVVRPPV